MRIRQTGSLHVTIVVLWPDYAMYLVEIDSCLSHPPTSGVFFKCICTRYVATFPTHKAVIWLISHVLGMNIFGIFLNGLSLSLSLTHTHTRTHTHTHAHTRTQTHTHTPVVFCYPFCIAIVLPCSWYEHLWQKRLKTHGKTYAAYRVPHNACRIPSIWNLSLMRDQ